MEVINIENFKFPVSIHLDSKNNKSSDYEDFTGLISSYAYKCDILPPYRMHVEMITDRNYIEILPSISQGLKHADILVNESFIYDIQIKRRLPRENENHTLKVSLETIQ